MKKLCKWWVMFGMAWALMAGTAMIIKKFGGTDNLMLWMLAGIYAVNMADGLSKDDKPDAKAS